MRDPLAAGQLMLLMIDNYDSFTWNVVQYLRELGAEVEVHSNDALTLQQIQSMAPEHIVISPGPGRPAQAGISMAVIREFAGQVPILGICLGQQCIGQLYGGVVVKAGRVMHGKTSAVHHRGIGVFAGLPSPFTATRYHSLIVDQASLPDCLEVTAWTDDEHSEIMGLRHRELAVEGVQFHPESILTEHGQVLLNNFLHQTR